ncbi:MAG: metallophosphatase family protein [Ignavibacteriae bacterium]|nr:metallophosphatase family protein [Ignavibacteriota bacterium]
MRIAIISDIHANLPALTAALGFLQHHQIDNIVCLGDIVGYGAQPNECIELVRQQCSHAVLGNHDAVAIGSLPLNHLNAPGKAAMRWTMEVLTKDNTQYLASLPLLLEHENATFVHASPFKPEFWTYIDSPFKAKDVFAAMNTELCFIGHTHVPGILCEKPGYFQLRKGFRFLINVGSIGQPRDGNPKLSLGIFDSTDWTYENYRLDYDIQRAADSITQNRLPSSLSRRLFQGM